MLRVLSLLESRVLGVLVEKERTVPDSYPLTLNALVAGCNQKSSRDPALNASETDVQAGGDGLKSMLLVIERSGGRVARYAHKCGAHDGCTAAGGGASRSADVAGGADGRGK